MSYPRLHLVFKAQGGISGAATHVVQHLSKEINDIMLQNQIMITDPNKVNYEFSQQTMKFIKEDRDFIVNQFNTFGLNCDMILEVYKNNPYDPSIKELLSSYMIDFEMSFVVTNETVECGIKFFDQILNNYFRKLTTKQDILPRSDKTTPQNYPNTVVNGLTYTFGLNYGNNYPGASIINTGTDLFTVLNYNPQTTPNVFYESGIRAKGLNIDLNEDKKKSTFFNDSTQIWNTDSNSITRITIKKSDISSVSGANKQRNLLSEISKFKTTMEFQKPILKPGDPDTMPAFQYMRLRPAVFYIISDEGFQNRRIANYGSSGQLPGIQLSYNSNDLLYPTIAYSSGTPTTGNIVWEKQIASGSVWRIPVFENAGDDLTLRQIKRLNQFEYLEIEFGFVFDHNVPSNYSGTFLFSNPSGGVSPSKGHYRATLESYAQYLGSPYGWILYNNWWQYYKPDFLYSDYEDSQGTEGRLNIPIVEIEMNATSNRVIGENFSVKYITNQDVFFQFGIPYQSSIVDYSTVYTTPYIIMKEDGKVPVTLEDWVRAVCKLYGAEFYYNTNTKKFYFELLSNSLPSNPNVVYEKDVKKLSLTTDHNLLYSSIKYGEKLTTDDQMINTSYLQELTYESKNGVITGGVTSFKDPNFTKSAIFDITSNYILTNPSDLLYYFEYKDQYDKEGKQVLEPKNNDEHNQIYIYDRTGFYSSNIPSPFITPNLPPQWFQYNVFNALFTPQRCFNRNSILIRSLFCLNDFEIWCLENTSLEGNSFILQSKVDASEPTVTEGVNITDLTDKTRRKYTNRIWKFTCAGLSWRAPGNNGDPLRDIFQFVKRDGTTMWLQITEEVFTYFPEEKEYTCVELIDPHS